MRLGGLGFVSQVCDSEQVKECLCVSVSPPVKWGPTHANSIGLKEVMCMCAENGVCAADAGNKWEASSSTEESHWAPSEEPSP